MKVVACFVESIRVYFFRGKNDPPPCKLHVKYTEELEKWLSG